MNKPLPALFLALTLSLSPALHSQPLSDQQLLDLIYQQPPLSSGQLKTILLDNSPLSDTVLIAAFTRQPGLPNGIISEIALANSPLSNKVLFVLKDLDPPLPPGILNEVLAENTLTIHGRLLNNLACDTSLRLAGVEVTLTDLSGNPVTSAVATGPQGEFFLDPDEVAALNPSALFTFVLNSDIPLSFSAPRTPEDWMRQSPVALFAENTLSALFTFAFTSAACIDFFSQDFPEVEFAADFPGGVAPYTYQWDFGDGNEAEGESPTNVYEEPGAFTVSLTVIDSLRCLSIAQQQITIENCPMGVLFNNDACGGGPAGGVALSIRLLIQEEGVNELLSEDFIATTNAAGEFFFDPDDINNLREDLNDLYPIVPLVAFEPLEGLGIEDQQFVPIDELLGDLPVSLTLSSSTIAWHDHQGEASLLDAIDEDPRASVATAIDVHGHVFVAGAIMDNLGSIGSTSFGVIKYDRSGNALWIREFANPTGSQPGNTPTAIVVTDNCEVYVTGVGAEGGGVTHYLTVKYDAAGNLLWSRTYTGSPSVSSQNLARAIAQDACGNIYVTGRSIDGSTGDAGDYGTVKYDPEGNMLWAATYKGPATGAGKLDEALAITARNGKIFVTGYSRGATSRDIATVAYDESGNELWATRYNGAGNGEDLARDIAADITGNVYVTGYASTALSDRDMVTIKYDSNGNEQWVATHPGAAGAGDEAFALAVHSDGSVYITGAAAEAGLQFPDAFLITQGEGGGLFDFDMVTNRYGADGSLLWSRSYDGAGATLDGAFDIALDQDGNAYITGVTHSLSKNKAAFGMAFGINSSATVFISGPGFGTIQLDPPPLVAFGTGEATTLSYDADGGERWVHTYKGAGNSQDGFFALALDDEGGVYATGFSALVDTVTFDVNVKMSTVKVGQCGGAGAVEGQEDICRDGSNCAAALILYPDTIYVPSVHDIAGQEIYFSFSPVTSGNTIMLRNIDSSGTGHIDKLELFSGTCSDLTLLDSAGLSEREGVISLHAENLINGAYTIKASRAGSAVSSRFEISVLLPDATACALNPDAKDCMAAHTLSANEFFQICQKSGRGLIEEVKTGTPGNLDPNLPGAGCLRVGELNITWFVINIANNGGLEFAFDRIKAGQVRQAGFYDWVMYPYNDNTCALLPKFNIPPVACNWNGDWDLGTGIKAFITGNEYKNYVDVLGVTCGERFLIGFSNYGGKNTHILHGVDHLVNFESFGSAGLSPSPVSTLIVSADKNEICLGDCATLTIANGTGPYRWYEYNGSRVGNGASITICPTNTTSYLVTDDGIGCATSITIGVNPPPPPFLGPTTDMTFCEDDVPAIMEVNASVIPTQGHTYTITPFGTQIGASGFFNILNLTQTTTFTITVTNTATGCSVAHSFTVTVIPSDFADAGDDVIICAGESIQLNTSGGVSYQWSPPGTLSDPASPNPVATPSTTITYTVTVTDANGCVSSDQVTVTVDQISVFTPDVTLCTDPVQINTFVTGGIGDLTYSWSPTQGLSDPGAVAPLASPSVTTVYMVTVTDDLGCTGTSSVTVTVDPVANAGQDVTVCSGESASVGATTGITPVTVFAWSPATGLDDPASPQPLATPSSTTTYTLTVTGPGGCITTDEVIVIVDDLAAFTAPEAIVCASIPSVQINVFTTGGTGPLTYAWSPALFLDDPNSSSPLASPTSATTYTVTVTDANGCTAAAQVAVLFDPTCGDVCGATATRTVPPNASSLLLTNFVTDVVDLSGTVTIDNDFVIDNSNVRMAKGSAIVVNTGNTLTLRNTAHLYSCTQLWNGITVMPGAKLVVEGCSGIEDAELAIDLKNGPLITDASLAVLDGAILNKNHRHVVIRKFGFGHPFSTGGSDFTCKASNTSPGGALKAPRSGQRTLYGIEAENVRLVKVGGTAKASNLFQNTFVGIKATDTDLEVINNKFDRIIRLDFEAKFCPPQSFCPFPQEGVAVLAIDTDIPRMPPGFLRHTPAPPPGANSIIVRNNRFTDCYRGVDVTEYYTNIVEFNYFDNDPGAFLPAPFLPVADHGVFIKNYHTDNISVNANTILDYKTGIHLLRQNTHKLFSTINVIGNVIQSSLPHTGIFAEEVNFSNFGSSGLNPDYRIEGNSVFDAEQGIVVTLLSRTSGRFAGDLGAYVNVTANTVTLRPSSSAAGIRARATSLLSVRDNRVTGQANISDPGQASVRGIYMTLCPSSQVLCNEVTQVGQSMVFESPMLLTTVWNNKMTGALDGLVMLNDGQVGQQGETDQPSGNEWQGTFARSQANVMNADGRFSPFFVRNIIPQFKPLDNLNLPLSSVFRLDFRNAIGPARTCPFTLQVAPPQDTAETLSMIADDQMSFEAFPEASRWLGRQFAFRMLKQKPDLMNDRLPLKAFYDSTAAACMGQLEEVDDLIAEGAHAAAQVLNNRIRPTCLIEENAVTYNKINIRHLFSGRTSLSSQEEAQLFAIARQCPLTGGEAVYKARTMLNLLVNGIVEFEDNCPVTAAAKTGAGERRDIVNETTKSAFRYALFPNPNDGNMEMAYRLPEGSAGSFGIFDVTGRNIAEYRLSEKDGRLIVRQQILVNGSYFYRIAIDGVPVATGKLVVIR